MEKGTVCLVTRNGLGEAPEDLQRILAVNFSGYSRIRNTLRKPSYSTPMASSWPAKGLQSWKAFGP